MSLFIVPCFLMCFVSCICGQVLEGFDPSCQSHYTSEYGYRLFFNLPPSSFLKDGSIQFNFSISAPSDGHVLIAEKPKAYPSYEVVIGGGMNSFSEIRKYVGNKAEHKISQVTKQILSANEIRNFSITIKDSQLSVFSFNNTLKRVILSWKDLSPLDVKYVSFSAWTGVTVSWFYDCKGVTPVQEELSALRKLKRKVLHRYDPYSVPVQDDDKLMIDTSIAVHHINLDAKTALLTTHAKFNFTWEDYRIKWSPKDYDDITNIVSLHREVWLPEFTLYNSFLNDGSSPMHKSAIRISHTGVVSWKPEAQMVTWCSLTLKEWPFDEHECNITMGLYSHPESVHISLTSEVVPTLTLENVGWNLISLTGRTIMTSNSYKPNKTEGAMYESHQAFLLQIKIRRNAPIHIYSYFIPIIGSIMIVTASFWLPVFSSARQFLHSTCLVLLLINLLALDFALPAVQNSPPHIMFVTCNMLFLSVIHIIFTCFIKGYVKKDQTAPSKFVARIVTNKTVQSIFRLGGYTTMEDDDILPEDSSNTNCVNSITNKDQYIHELVRFRIPASILSFETLLYNDENCIHIF